MATAITLALVAATWALPIRGIEAQAAEVVRGRVLDDSARALVGATVSITRGPDRLVQVTSTDSSGHYSSRFDPGTGDYLVHVSALGFRSARRRVERVGNERELVADFTMARDMATVLAAVNVRANRAVRATAQVSSGSTPEVGAAESWSQGVTGQVSPNAAGNLNTIAGTMPGVVMTAGGPSMLGADVSSNLTTLNGMALPGGQLPRAARADVRVSGATYDATRGGFAGANIDVRLAPGDRNFQRRNAYLTVNAPQLQVTDAVGRSLGLTNGGFRASLGADGEAIRRVLTYNMSLDVGRTVSDPATLVGGDAGALLRAGLSPDSALRVQQVAGNLGLPLAGSGIPGSRVQNSVTWLGRLDDVRDTLRTLTLTSYLGRTTEGAVAFGPLVAPAAGAQQSQLTLGAQFVHAQYVGSGYNTLMQNRAAISRVHDRTTPYVSLPGVTVLARSASDASSSDIVPVQLGGNPFLVTDDTRWTAEAANEFTWNAVGRIHRFKTALWGRADGLRQTGVTNALGQYTYNSVADLAANRPVSYTRTLVQPEREAVTYNAALAFAHQWNPSRFFNAIYGVRLEGSAFGDAPPANAALEQALGVRTGMAPARLHLSPRVGFTYTYNRHRSNGSGVMMTNVGTWYRTMQGTFRGGIGEFRDLYRPTMLSDAMVGAGLPGSTLSLSCVGASVPIPDWQAMAGGEASLPTTCLDGSGALAERAPSVTLVDSRFDAPRSWRASLGWSSTVRNVMVRLDGLASYDLSQPGTVDANFSGVSRFTLTGEDNRPMYVSPTAIDAGSGAVSARESRRSNDYGRVAMRTSDLRGYGGQITAMVQPEIFRGAAGPPPVMFSVAYTLQEVRRQFRGSDGASFGDPRVKEWAAGVNDARHAIVVQSGLNIPHVGTLTLFTRFQSGLPFTPVVRNDVDGDGRAGDRAFIPNPATETDATTAAQMQDLLSTAPGNVRSCLESQMGRVAGRMSCRGAWTQNMNLMLQPNIGRLFGRMASVNVMFENPLAALDQALHGSNGLRGWGSQAMPDPTLLIPRGFDSGTQRFRYDVNPRFGDTRAFRTLSRTPFRVVVDVSMNLSVPYELQQLRRAIEPVRTPDRKGWMRRGVDSVAALYLQQTSNIHRLLLAESDSLFLTKEQINRLLHTDSVFSAQVRDLYYPLARFLVEQPSGVAGPAAVDSVRATTRAFWPLFWAQVDSIVPILTPQQRELLPLVQNLLAVTRERRLTAQWHFGYAVPVRHNRPRIGGEPGGSNVSIARD